MVKTPDTRLRRFHEKADYGPDVIHAILDAQPLAHIGHLVDGFPVVTPTLQWREGDRVYWHGSSASRMIRASAGQPVSLCVTLLDGLVLARSGFEHSVQFRSVMVFGIAEQVSDSNAKAQHLQVMIEQMYPARWAQLRPMMAQEVKATAVLSLPIDAASAKIGTGMPTDPVEDRDWPVWAGVIPLRQIMGDPQPDGAPRGPPPTIKRF
ncbi:MAG: pyridoxamine 5'-phosphate oxidase family protein [Pseudorhodobacter sp.]|nr:pyridoxamine 5'-phosphate oxidase family protein [Pseudorhodobacter sp.]